MDIEYNFWDDRTHEIDINPCEGCCDYDDGQCISFGGCLCGVRPYGDEYLLEPYLVPYFLE